MNAATIEASGLSKGHGKAHLSKSGKESTSTLHEDLKQALHEVRNGELIRINPKTYKEDIKRRLK
jgi:hypothetical protein